MSEHITITVEDKSDTTGAILRIDSAITPDVLDSAKHPEYILWDTVKGLRCKIRDAKLMKDNYEQKQ